MRPNSPDPEAGLTAAATSVKPSGGPPERRSPASAVCYMDAVQAPPAHTKSPKTAVDGQRHVGSASPAPRTRDELDRTPRSENPPSLSAAAERQLPQLHATQPEPGYFSPQPVRPYGPKLPQSAPVSTRPSPTSSLNVSTTSVNVASRPLPDDMEKLVTADSRRPSVQRDDSSASIASSVTVRPQSVDPYQAFIPQGDGQGPHYPNQSYAALQFQHYPAAHHPPGARPRPRHQHGVSLSTPPITAFGVPPDHHRDMVEYGGSRTAGNSPAGSPGLFNPTTPPLRPGQHPDDGFYSSPYLHHTHRQAPKETHVADVDVDPVSGRKIINQYEVMDELGRGVHGKVKLGRNMETGLTVAIKIVDRYSKRRRLDKNTSREDKIKREIAILKKARHQNIVSLIEVIDDPTRKKVYIVLEHVELGEVKWRTAGEKEICLIEWRRYHREAQGRFHDESAAMEDERIIALAHQKLARQQRRRAKQLHERRLGQTGNEPWSLEHGGDSDEDYPASGRSSRASTISDGPTSSRHKLTENWKHGHRETNMETAVRATTPTSASRHPDPNTSADLEGTMYGACDADSTRSRCPSLAESTSSHFTDEEDEVPEHFRYVPLLTLQAALETFRDTVLGLQYLHFQKVIHRDIKPANLLQTREHRIKISDFGVSYLGRARQQDVDGDQSETEDLGEAIELAKTVGTPAFYAPELCRLDDGGDMYPVSEAIDIWALGVTLYCLIYGRVPFHDHNTFKLMKIIAEDEVYIPHYRLKAVAEQTGGSRPSSHGRMYASMTTDQRAPHELEYEEVSDLLRDLLKRLLTKDPRKRITIAEIKRHPWVLQGLDIFHWVEETDPDRITHGRRIEVSKDDMEKAVVPVTLIDRVRSGVRKTIDTVFGRRAASSRRRAQTTATGPDLSPSISAHSSSSTVSQEGRRPSLAMNQSIFEALSRSREPDHPLSQSVTASPEAKERPRYFESNSRTGSPAHSVESGEHLAPLAGTFRPLPLERAQSSTSSASIQTVRQIDVSRLSPKISPALPGTPKVLGASNSSNLGNLGAIFGGGQRLMNSMRSRERLSKPSKPITEHTRASSERLADAYDDPHGGPSIALSTAFAAGHVDQPDALKEMSPSFGKGSWPYPSDGNSLDSLERTSSRQSSMSSVSSYLNKPYGDRHDPADYFTHTPPRREVFDERYSPAKDEPERRKEEEGGKSRARPLSINVQRPTSSLSYVELPPSLEEAVVSQRQKVEDWQKLDDYRHHDYVASQNTSLVGYSAQTQVKPLASSSSDDHFASISQSTSNPSIPSVVSANSSLPDDTPRPHHDISAAPSDDSILQFDAPPEDPTGYDGDHPLESDESEEEFIVMDTKRPLKSSRQSRPIATPESSKNIRKEYLGERRRSARSGSNGTVKKIRPDFDSEHNHTGS